ncbi:MAG: hypothetical protein ACJAYU_001437 [Bradymonadia bacterium]
MLSLVSEQPEHHQHGLPAEDGLKLASTQAEMAARVASVQQIARDADTTTAAERSAERAAIGVG